MSSTKPFKRLIIACDGTWVNSDNGVTWSNQTKLAIPSNVTRICRAINPTSDEGIPQIVFYQAGLGSANSWWSYYIGGYTGQGIDDNIKQAYAFLCNNYTEGDEIILLGFSRGAFTARSIGGLISSIGLLTRHGLSTFYPIFKDWENQENEKYVPSFETTSWPLKGRPKFSDPSGAYVKAMRAANLTGPTIPLIKAVGVWDTVGTLGVPTMKLFGIPIHTDSTVEYSFINTEVAPNVQNAYQALALDERRTPFSPTVWECPALDSGEHNLKELKQTWFPGVHSSIGGGYEDTSISDITLAWMITQLTPHLSFDKTYVPRQRAQNQAFYEEKAKSNPSLSVRPWAMGLLKRSDESLLNIMMGRSWRTPGEYHSTDPKTGKPLQRKLERTCEFIHPSVRYRIKQKGAGLADSDKDFVGKGLYKPSALDGWKFKLPGEDGAEIAGKRWNGHGVWVLEHKDGSKTHIVEERIDENSPEMELIKGWPEGYKAVDHVLYTGPVM